MSSKTAAERGYLQRAAALGCALCRHLGLGATPAELHHPREGTGMGRRAAHTDVIPLCPEHHRGRSGIHGLGRRAFERTYGVTERELVEATRALVSASTY
ncbi:MAG: Ref family recombination enhancement nuclease [Rhodocyclaceae bacterium]